MKRFALALSLLFSMNSFAISDTISCQSLDQTVQFSMSQTDDGGYKISLQKDRELITDLMLGEVNITETAISFDFIDLIEMRGYTFIFDESFSGHNTKLIDIGAPGTESVTYKLNCTDN